MTQTRRTREQVQAEIAELMILDWEVEQAADLAESQDKDLEMYWCQDSRSDIAERIGELSRELYELDEAAGGDDR
jgi:hypothetical protein